jgi:hypothetical protein
MSCMKRFPATKGESNSVIAWKDEMGPVNCRAGQFLAIARRPLSRFGERGQEGLTRRDPPQPPSPQNGEGEQDMESGRSLP